MGGLTDDNGTEGAVPRALRPSTIALLSALALGACGDAGKALSPTCDAWASCTAAIRPELGDAAAAWIDGAASCGQDVGASCEAFCYENLLDLAMAHPDVSVCRLPPESIGPSLDLAWGPTTFKTALAKYFPLSGPGIFMATWQAHCSDLHSFDTWPQVGPYTALTIDNVYFYIDHAGEGVPTEDRTDTIDPGVVLTLDENLKDLSAGDHLHGQAIMIGDDARGAVSIDAEVCP